MSKFYSITRDQVVAMIEDVNESITAVTTATIMETTEAVVASIHEDAVWTDSQEDVTFSSIMAVVEEWVADRTTNEPTPIILDSDIAMAVTSMMNAIERCNEPDAARRTAEIAARKIQAAGGHAWINPFWYGVDQIDTPNPTTRHGNAQAFEYIKWPRAQVRDVVEYQRFRWRVVANYVSPGVAGRWVRQFSFYAIMPV